MSYTGAYLAKHFCNLLCSYTSCNNLLRLSIPPPNDVCPDHSRVKPYRCVSQDIAIASGSSSLALQQHRVELYVEQTFLGKLEAYEAGWKGVERHRLFANFASTHS